MSLQTNKNTAHHPHYRLPLEATLKHLVKYSILEDKPILFDYWTTSLDKTAFIGIKTDTSEKLLVKSEDEYTSPIAKFFKSAHKDDASIGEYIIVTENSIYVVDSNIPTRKIK